MRALKLTMAYDGTAYAGWQVQLDRPTIQGHLEQALNYVTGESIRVVASGRTDAGVHALGQVVSLATQSTLDTDALIRALNARLPTDIAILAAREMPEGFHAIRDAASKRYRYVILNSAIRDVFQRSYAWHYPQALDVEAMSRAAAALVGRHDFASFQSSGADRDSTVRSVTALTVRRDDAADADRIVLEITADGFLYNMVRAIVGTLVEVGRGAESEAWPGQVLAARSRAAGGPTAPPQGLFLVNVEYPD